MAVTKDDTTDEILEALLHLSIQPHSTTRTKRINEGLDELLDRGWYA